ncbi:uncharacterized protein LOC128209828 [Mya arenaria]|uniref:uncharacterized protein LOC128209828 n=1 Tax=Mya arenaria TaxID=6604 RepID=UPI0022E64788|nr:uncharacterized protein LOC128209828 [Mya arenaria]
MKSNMNSKVILCIVLLLLSKYVQGGNIKRKVKFLPLVSTAVDVADSIYQIAMPNDQADAVTPEQLEEAKNEILKVFSEKLAVVQAQLYGTIKETMLLANIDEINYKIQSVLLDLENYLLEKGNEQKKLEFERQAALFITDIRSLPSRLEKSFANADVSLLELMASNSKCNMSGINEFRDMYLNLTETGIIIELTYKKLQDSSIETGSEWWDSQVRQMIDSFEKGDTACKNKFIEMLRTNMVTIDNVTELSTLVHQNYVWYIIDIFILEQKQPEEKIFIDGTTSNMMALLVNGLRKYAIYIDRQTRSNDIKCLLLKTYTQTPLDNIFVLDAETPVPGYISTIDGEFKKTSFYYGENGLSESCHPDIVPDIEVLDTPESEESKDGLTVGQIAGIVTGSVLVVSILVSVCCWCCRRKKMELTKGPLNKHTTPVPPCTRNVDLLMKLEIY